MTLLIQAKRSRLPVRPSHAELRSNIAQMRFPFGISPERSLARRTADQLSADDLQSPRIAGIGLLFGSVEVTVHGRQRLAGFHRQSVNLFAERPEAKRVATAHRGGEVQLLPRPIHF